MAKHSALQDGLSDTFAALADPTRRATLARLAAGEASVTELAELFELSLPAISKYLKVLQRAGLVARGRRAQWRPCRLRGGPLKEVADWVERYVGSGSRASIAWMSISARRNAKGRSAAGRRDGATGSQREELIMPRVCA